LLTQTIDHKLKKGFKLRRLKLAISRKSKISEEYSHKNAARKSFVHEIANFISKNHVSSSYFTLAQKKRITGFEQKARHIVNIRRT